MVGRTHLVAAFGVPAEVFASVLETPGREVGGWRVSTLSSVAARDTAILDARLALLSRKARGLALRASTAGGQYAVVAVQHDGRYLALFDHPYGGLDRDLREPFLDAAAQPASEGHPADSLDPDLLDLDAPVPPNRLGALAVRDDEILARLHAGESPRQAWESVLRDRAAVLANGLAAAGVPGVDTERIRHALHGDARLDLDPWWGDLPNVLEAIGLAGISTAWPTTHAESGDGEPSADDETPDPEPDAGADPTSSGADLPTNQGEASMPARSSALRAGGATLAFSMLAGAVAGGWWAGRYESMLAVVGGATLGLVAPVVLLVAAFALWLVIGAARMTLFSWRHRRGPAAEDRTLWTRHLPPTAAEPARRTLMLWSELAATLDPRRAPAPHPATTLYGDVFLPVDRGSRELRERLERPGEIATFGPALEDLRVELLDRRLAGAPVDDLAVRFRQLLRPQP